jgi:hypothetical protein
MKPSTENLLHAIQMVVLAACERRTDIPREVMKKIYDLRSDLQYLEETDCE